MQKSQLQKIQKLKEVKTTAKYHSVSWEKRGSRRLQAKDERIDHRDDAKDERIDQRDEAKDKLGGRAHIGIPDLGHPSLLDRKQRTTTTRDARAHR